MPDLSKKFRVLLTPELRAEFEAAVRKKSLGAAKIRRATVLLMADEAHPEHRAPLFADRDACAFSGSAMRRCLQRYPVEVVAIVLLYRR